MRVCVCVCVRCICDPFCVVAIALAAVTFPLNFYRLKPIEVEKEHHQIFGGPKMQRTAEVLNRLLPFTSVVVVVVAVVAVVDFVVVVVFEFGAAFAPIWRVLVFRARAW